MGVRSDFLRVQRIVPSAIRRFLQRQSGFATDLFTLLPGLAQFVLRQRWKKILEMKIVPAANRAFTLIEILLALSIFLLVMVGIYSVPAGILRGTAVGLQAAADGQRARVAMATLEDAIVTAQIYTENIRYYSFVADTSEKFPFLGFTSRLPADFPGSGLFGDDVVRLMAFTSKKGLIIRTNWS